MGATAVQGGCGGHCPPLTDSRKEGDSRLRVVVGTLLHWLTLEGGWRLSKGVWWVQECQKKLDHKLSLDSYLLKPVQRITKYQLLLKVRGQASLGPPPGPMPLPGAWLWPGCPPSCTAHSGSRPGPSLSSVVSGHLPPMFAGPWLPTGPPTCCPSSGARGGDTGKQALPLEHTRGRLCPADRGVLRSRSPRSESGLKSCDRCSFVRGSDLEGGAVGDVSCGGCSWVQGGVPGHGGGRLTIARTPHLGRGECPRAHVVLPHQWPPHRGHTCVPGRASHSPGRGGLSVQMAVTLPTPPPRRC